MWLEKTLHEWVEVEEKKLEEKHINVLEMKAMIHINDLIWINIRTPPKIEDLKQKIHSEGDIWLMIRAVQRRQGLLPHESR